jgi:protein subunit release factor B
MDSFHERLTRLGLNLADFEESFARSSGPGGQHVNKVSTSVTLRHRPSGLMVTAQDSRSQSANRQLARERLLDAIENQARAERQAVIDAREKRRRTNAPRPYGVKQSILRSKRRRAEVKTQRRSGAGHD